MSRSDATPRARPFQPKWYLMFRRRWGSRWQGAVLVSTRPLNFKPVLLLICSDPNMQSSGRVHVAVRTAIENNALSQLLRHALNFSRALPRNQILRNPSWLIIPRRKSASHALPHTQPSGSVVHSVCMARSSNEGQRCTACELTGLHR